MLYFIMAKLLSKHCKTINYGKELSIMIQDIAPHTYHNEYKPVAPE